MRSHRSMMLALAGLALFLSGATRTHADTLIDHANGISADAQGTVTRFSALLIGNDGRIVRLLQPHDPHPRTTYVLDAKGATLLPGFVDAHVQMMALGFAALTLDLSDTSSLKEAQAKIAAYAGAHPDRPWILGRGWDASRWALNDASGHMRFPTAAELNMAVSDRPVWLISRDGHAGWANRRAMELAGIKLTTKNPEGGLVIRLATPIHTRSEGHPSGVFVNSAMNLVSRLVPAPRAEDRDLAFSTAQDILLRHGITAVSDMGTTIEAWQAYRRAGDDGRLQIRIIAYADGIDNMALIAGAGPSRWLYDDRLRLVGVRLGIDGALATRGAWLKAPYADVPSYDGLVILKATQLKNLMSRAAMDHFQLSLDTHGDAAFNEGLDALGDLDDTYKGDRRWRLESASMIDPIDLPRLVPLALRAGGIAISIAPLALRADQTMALSRLGEQRLGETQAWVETAAGSKPEQGKLVLAFGSQAPDGPSASLVSLMAASDSKRMPMISRVQALIAATVGSAWASFADDRFGQIAPGMRADFLLVSADPLTVKPSDVAAIKLHQVWIAGRRVWPLGAASWKTTQDRATSLPKDAPYKNVASSALPATVKP